MTEPRTAAGRDPGVRTDDEPEWTGPDPLREMVAKAHVVCRKTRGHEQQEIAQARAAALDEARAAIACAKRPVLDADDPPYQAAFADALAAIDALRETER